MTRRNHWRTKDHSLVDSLLRWLHAAIPAGEAHDALHDLVAAMGGPPDWLHKTRSR